MIEFEIKFTNNIPSKKNSKQLFKAKSGRSFISSSENYKTWHQEWMLKLRLLKSKYKITKPLDNCYLVYTFYAPNLRAYDLSNKVES